MSRQDLITELAKIILDTTSIMGISPDSLTEETALIGKDLNLDSIDMLSCIVAFEHKYKMNIENAAMGRAIFENLGTIADYIQKKQTQIS